MLLKLHNILVWLDLHVWYYMNVAGHNTVMDAFVPFLRNQWTWAPLYLFLAIFMPLNFGRKGWMWCVFFLLTFAMSDYLSASVAKVYFHRLRPCNNPFLATTVHLLVPCGSGYSFPSTHATNHFALGIFSAMSLQSRFKWIWPVALIWAFSVSYAQVYVGVHFPLDVTCGALLGLGVGQLTGRVYNRIYKLGGIPAGQNI